jgi:hypothetical protein
MVGFERTSFHVTFRGAHLHAIRYAVLSRADKTSLLNILAGHTATRGRITIKADVCLNDYKVDAHQPKFSSADRLRCTR